MKTYKVKKGLALPLPGALTTHEVAPGPHVKEVAILGPDYPSMKPLLCVQIGERVKTGQPLFTDSTCTDICYTSPAAGIVSAIHRGEKRVFHSVVVKLEGNDYVSFPEAVEAFKNAGTQSVELKKVLMKSGLWTAFRMRPFDKVPMPKDTPSAIFVTATDTEPLAFNPEDALRGSEAAFQTGLEVLTHLTLGTVYLCTSAQTSIRTQVPRVKQVGFTGKHPAGLAGTHIHMLEPVHATKCVWHIGLQDVIAIGTLCQSGVLQTERIIAITGPGVLKPQLLKVRMGSHIDELVNRNLVSNTPLRVISGSVLSGRDTSEAPFKYLGRYHRQVCVLEENNQRHFLGWLSLGAKTFSSLPVFLSKLTGEQGTKFSTTTHGSSRAMVPIGAYERVMPLDILPTFLLRALMSGDLERALELGCLELSEEDLALCTFVCPGKADHGRNLREMLNRIEKEG